MNNSIALPNRPGTKEISFEILREITDEDLEEIWGQPQTKPENSPRPGGALLRIRASHHKMAQLLAQGHKPQEVSQITGITKSRLATLANTDPAFQELVEHYRTISEVKFADVIERMRILGLDTIEELHDRLLNDPESFSKKDLLAITEMMLVKSGITGGPGGISGPPGGPGNGVAININFVKPSEGQIIDGEVG